jgi:hypothetical protein
MNEPLQKAPGSRAPFVIVKIRDDNDEIWGETTELINFSRSSAGFYLKRKCEVGRLVSMMLTMPKHLRGYDFDKELYRVWGLVQHCSQISGAADSTYHVGVAFTGRTAPASYDENPQQSYRIAGINEDGTWRIVEAKKDFVVRRHPRFQVALDVLLSTQDERRNLIRDDSARIENISASGASVFSPLKVDIGDSVNLDCVAHNFSALAIVRNRQTSEKEPPKLHLEFVNAEFPVSELKLPDKKALAEQNRALRRTMRTD